MISDLVEDMSEQHNQHNEMAEIPNILLGSINIFIGTIRS